MYVYIYICIDIYIYRYTYVRVYIYTYVHTRDFWICWGLWKWAMPHISHFYSYHITFLMCEMMISGWKVPVVPDCIVQIPSFPSLHPPILPDKLKLFPLVSSVFPDFERMLPVLFPLFLQFFLPCLREFSQDIWPILSTFRDFSIKGPLLSTSQFFQVILVGGLNPSEKYESQLGWLATQY